MTIENSAELDKYINDLADISEDTGNENDAANSGGDENADGGEFQQQDNQQNDGADAQGQGAEPTGAGAQQKGDGAQGQQQGKGGKDAKQGELQPVGDGTFANARGDIVDANGKLIAQSGFAARMYSTNKRLKAQLDDRTRQLDEISGAVSQLRGISQQINSYGLANQEVSQALDMASRMKKGDVLGVAKDVLAMIAAQGYNVTDLLGSEVGDSLELRAVKQMLDERLAPLTREEEARRQQEAHVAAATQAYNKFVSENEFADVHADDIVQVMQRDQLTPQQAYNKLYAFAARNNLDFSQPLGPQLRERQAQQRQPQQPQRTQQKPMPSGAATRGNGAVPTMPLASADDDWATIINQVQQTIGNA